MASSGTPVKVNLKVVNLNENRISLLTLLNKKSNKIDT